MNAVAVQSNLANLEHAFYVAEKIGVIRLLRILKVSECLDQMLTAWKV